MHILYVCPILNPPHQRPSLWKTSFRLSLRVASQKKYCIAKGTFLSFKTALAIAIASIGVHMQRTMERLPKTWMQIKFYHLHLQWLWYYSLKTVQLPLLSSVTCLLAVCSELHKAQVCQICQYLSWVNRKVFDDWMYTPTIDTYTM